MGYLFLTATVILSAVQHVTSKQYNLKARENNPFWFSGMTSFTALLFFIVISGFKFNFTSELIPYSVGFAAAYAAALIGFNMAVRTGPLSISSLILSYSLVIPTFYGVIFLNEQMGITSYAGFVLLVISLFLINMKKEPDMKLSLVWLIFIVICFIGNGMCSTVQKMQQMHFDGAYKNEFMIVSLIIVTSVLFIFGAFQKGKKSIMFIDCAKFGPFYGLANGIINLLVMLLAGMLPNTVIFPTISAGGIVITFVLALTIYKEKLSKMQLIGYTAGIASVVLLNI